MNEDIERDLEQGTDWLKLQQFANKRKQTHIFYNIAHMYRLYIYRGKHNMLEACSSCMIPKKLKKLEFLPAQTNEVPAFLPKAVCLDDCV